MTLNWLPAGRKVFLKQAISSNPWLQIYLGMYIIFYSDQNYFLCVLAAFGKQTSVNVWIIDSHSFWAKLHVFTGDALNGLINCYKGLLDLVKRKIAAKSLCTIDLSQLIVISTHKRWKWHCLLRIMHKVCLREHWGQGRKILHGSWVKQRQAAGAMGRILSSPMQLANGWQSSRSAAQLLWLQMIPWVGSKRPVRLLPSHA